MSLISELLIRDRRNTSQSTLDDAFSVFEALHSETLPHREKVGGSREVTSLGMNSLISFGCCTVYLCCAREDDVSPSLLFVYSYLWMKDDWGTHL